MVRPQATHVRAHTPRAIGRPTGKQGGEGLNFASVNGFNPVGILRDICLVVCWGWGRPQRHIICFCVANDWLLRHEREIPAYAYEKDVCLTKVKNYEDPTDGMLAVHLKFAQFDHQR